MIIDLIYLISICFCILTAFTICFKINKNKFLGGYLLAFYLLLNAVCNAFYLFIEYDFILYFPYLYKIPAPLTFLIAPSAYIYVRATLFNESSFKLKDIIHLVPFVLFSINYLPLYFLPHDQKEALVQNVLLDISYTYTHQDGFLPEWTNIVTRAFLSMVYLVAQWLMVRRFFKLNPISNKGFLKIKHWIYTFLRLQTAYWVGLIFIYFIYAYDIASVSQIGSFVSLSSATILSIFFFALSTYLLLNPSIFLNINRSILPEHNLNVQAVSETFESLKFTILDKELFLNPKLTLGLLSSEVGISQKNISFIVSQIGFENFNDFINDIRVANATEKLHSVALENFSIEAIAQSCGFNSKATFYRTFKKTHQCTPTEYLKANSRSPR